MPESRAPLRVLVLATYPLGRVPGQRFRWEQYIEPLRERDIHLETSSFLAESALDLAHAEGAWSAKASMVLAGLMRRLRDATAARRYDLVLVFRESSPVGPPWVELMLRALGVPYAFDFDDAIYLSNSSGANRRLAWLKNSGKTASVVRRATLVLAGNPELATWARVRNPRVVVVPTTIDTRIYSPAKRPVPERLCIGWSGSPSTVEHLSLLVPVLRDLQRQQHVRLRVIGDAGFRIEGAEVEALQWREETELEDLRGIDIGVMPLPESEWARGKCGLKALQYMALGIPTVLSPVGVNRHIARGGAAVEASTPGEWSAALEALIKDQELRERIGSAGCQRVEDEYSVNAQISLWERALRIAAAPGVSAGAVADVTGLA